MDENQPKIIVPADLCDWCGKPMPSGIVSKNLVCPRCYSLLIGAGLSDERIYTKAVYQGEL